MADNKKISELESIPTLEYVDQDDEFVFVDKSIMDGVDASSSGKTSRVTFGKLASSLLQTGPQGDPGPPGDKGDKGDAGEDGTFNSLTQTEKDSLKGDPGVDGEDGESFEFSDFTSTQLEGPEGHKGSTRSW